MTCLTLRASRCAKNAIGLLLHDCLDHNRLQTDDCLRKFVEVWCVVRANGGLLYCELSSPSSETVLVSSDCDVPVVFSLDDRYIISLMISDITDTERSILALMIIMIHQD